MYPVDLENNEKSCEYSAIQYVAKRKFKFILDRRTLEKIYLTFIRPLLEYGDVVWDCKTVYLTNKLESVQAEAARVVTGGARKYDRI